MKALFVKQPGSTPELEIREVETPSVGAGDVLIEVAAAGLCGHDTAIITGVLRRGVDLDVILGHEISGRIAEVGDEVSDLASGDMVVASLTAFCGQCDRCRAGLDYRCRYGRGVGHAIHGGFAEYIRLPARCVTRIPAETALVGAALIACPIGVCARGIRSVARLSANESVLVTGAGGGLGIHAIQVALALGARQVFAATSSPEKLDTLERFAPGGVLLGGELDFSELALAFTDDMGVDVVIDTVGSDVFDSAVRSMAQYGRMVALGEVSGGRARLRLTDLMFRDASIRGSTGANLPDIAAAVDMVARGDVQPVVDKTFPLEEAAEAVQLAISRQATGRIALIP